jgi:hypothetical protein
MQKRVVACEPIVSGRDPSEVLQPIGSGLDAPAQLVQTLAEAERLLAVGAIWNDRFGSLYVQVRAESRTLARWSPS